MLAGRFREQLGVGTTDHGGGTDDGANFDGTSPGTADAIMDDSHDRQGAVANQHVGRLAEALGRIRQRLNGDRDGAPGNGDWSTADIPPPKMRRTAAGVEAHTVPTPRWESPPREEPYPGAQGVGLSSSSTVTAEVGHRRVVGGVTRGGTDEGRAHDAVEEAAVVSPQSREALLASLRAPQVGRGKEPLVGRRSCELQMMPRKRPLEGGGEPELVPLDGGGRPTRDAVRRRSGGGELDTMPTAVRCSGAEAAPRQREKFQGNPTRHSPSTQVSERSAKRSRISGPNLWPSRNGDEAEEAIRRLIGRVEPPFCKSGT